MWRNANSVVGGVLAACAATYFVPLTGSVAQSSTSFDARWLAINPAQKADRIDGPKASFDAKVYFFDLPTVQTTVVVKDNRKPDTNEFKEKADGIELPRNGSMQQRPVSPVRIRPHDLKSKDKLPVGCESSFSPVTTPAMANVSGRCVS